MINSFFVCLETQKLRNGMCGSWIAESFSGKLIPSELLSSSEKADGTAHQSEDTLSIYETSEHQIETKLESNDLSTHMH